MFLTEDWSSMVVIEHIGRKRSLQFITVCIFWRFLLRFLFLLFLLSITFFGDVRLLLHHLVRALLFLRRSFLFVTTSTVL